MPRAPRIEFEDACYHIMARGNRREPIVFDDDDRKLFVKTLSEAASRYQWEIFAWVLMDNHYHFVLRTPQANLVEGMQWFQNAYTRRLNAKHRLWGHLFGGRYRSILIENQDSGGGVWRDYLRTAIDYVHLNPGRAKIVDGVEKVATDYPWSSLAQGYALSPTKRPKWLAVVEGLDLYGGKDTAKGRRAYLTRYDKWIADESGLDYEVGGGSFEAKIRRGWFWGSEGFKEQLLKLLENEPPRQSRNYRSSATSRDTNLKRAQEILREGEDHYNLPIKELIAKYKGDWTRTSVAWAVWNETSMPHQWIADKLNLKSAANSSQQIRRFARVDEKELPRTIRKWKQSRNVA